jgi:hypothetical protein
MMTSLISHLDPGQIGLFRADRIGGLRGPAGGTVGQNREQEN